MTTLPRMFIADVGGGAMSAVIGILAALLGRERGGDGALDRRVDARSRALLADGAGRARAGRGRRHGRRTALPTFGDHACYNVYRTKDGEHVALGALEPKFWLAFCAAIGRDDLARATSRDTADQRALIDEVRRDLRVAARATNGWRSSMDHDLCLTPVNQPREALVDPHVVARGAVTAAPGLRAVRPPFAAEVAELAPAPALGDQTREILQRLT